MKMASLQSIRTDKLDISRIEEHFRNKLEQAETYIARVTEPSPFTISYHGDVANRS